MKLKDEDGGECSNLSVRFEDENYFRGTKRSVLMLLWLPQLARKKEQILWTDMTFLFICSVADRTKMSFYLKQSAKKFCLNHIIDFINRLDRWCAPKKAQLSAIFSFLYLNIMLYNLISFSR